MHTCRVGALFVLDRAKGQVHRAAQAHYQHTALARTRKHVLRRVGALQQRRLGRPVKVMVNVPVVALVSTACCIQHICMCITASSSR